MFLCKSGRAEITALAVLLVTSTNVAGLTLPEAERLTLQADPAVAAGAARSEALREDAVAEGQLPDPQFRLGMFNVPVDSFDVDREPTTQLRFGLLQAFPRGKTLQFRQRRVQWQAEAADALAADLAERALRGVRESFLELYYQVRAGRIIGDTRKLFTQLVKITQAHYGAGRVSQQDVLRAGLELSRLDDRETRIRNQEDVSRAGLAKWIGAAAGEPVAMEFPVVPEIADEEILLANLSRHPLIVAESARIESQDQAVAMAREQYKPGFHLGVEYRQRFGENPDGAERDDMMAAVVTMDLPLFRGKRQDRRLAASQREAQAARLTRTDRMRSLREMLQSEYANWRRLGERRALYEQQLVREAQANAEASLKAYQSGVTEFTTLMRARITELDVRLDDLRIRVDRAKAQARLLYLAAGENS